MSDARKRTAAAEQNSRAAVVEQSSSLPGEEPAGTESGGGKAARTDPVQMVRIVKKRSAGGRPVHEVPSDPNGPSPYLVPVLLQEAPNRTLLVSTGTVPVPGTGTYFTDIH